MTNQANKLIILTLTLSIIYIFFHNSLTQSERKLYNRILSAQKYLYDYLENSGLEINNDIYKSGFIGVEYSEITTTIGSLESKQCSNNPLWALQFIRWFHELGLKQGDKIIISASSSFPAMVYSCLAACESEKLDVTLLLSLGSSTWGANRPELTFSQILDTLNHGGYTKIRPSLYTLGGVNENAEDLSPEAREILKNSIKNQNLLLTGKTLDEIVNIKSQYLNESKLLINIGGNASSMGNDTYSLNLKPGIIFPNKNINGGNGLVGNALRQNIPVIHVLNLKGLAEQCGIDFSKRTGNFKRGRNIFAGLMSLIMFSLFMINYKRWNYE